VGGRRAVHRPLRGDGRVAPGRALAAERQRRTHTRGESALSRILHRPNDCETASSFMLNAVRDLFANGNTFSLALRNERFEVASLHLMNPKMSAPLVAETGDVFFRLAGNAVVDRLFGDSQLLVPQRDVLHVKLHSNHRYPHPLVGETPLAAAM